MDAKTSVIVRQATAEDAAAIARLHARSWRATYRGSYRDEYLDGPLDEERLAEWTERLSNPADSQFVVVAEDEDSIVGFACVYGGQDPKWGSFLDNIHADPDRHGEGIGTVLFLAVVEWCRQNYPERGLFLSVIDQNANAQRFYEGLGGLESGTMQPSSAWIMKGVKVRRYSWPTLDAVSKRARGTS